MIRSRKHGIGRVVNVSAVELLMGTLADAAKRYHGTIGVEKVGEHGKHITLAARMTIAWLTAGFIVGTAIRRPSKPSDSHLSLMVNP